MGLFDFFGKKKKEEQDAAEKNPWTETSAILLHASRKGRSRGAWLMLP